MTRWYLPNINPDLCTLCGLCEEFCPTSAIQITDAQPQITSPHNCSYCGICEEICPAGAVKLVYEIVL